MQLIYDLNFTDISELVTQIDGEPSFRARQLWEGLYRQFLQNPDEFTTLPKSFRSKLRELVSFDALVPTVKLDSSDGLTRKTLFKLQDGYSIEAVLMRYDKRQTLCISTQAGCAMGCVFCATGQMGFKRHLTSGEIAAQVMYYARLLAEENNVVTNIVVMGMGEPFHNYENTLSAIDRLNDPEGYNFGARRFTISTSGLVPAIRRFAEEKRQVNLAISLHAAEDALRTSMMPINKRYNINELLRACKYYLDLTNRRITFEWALIDGVNDSPEEAHRLAQKLKGMLCHVNAIPLNPTYGFSGKATSNAKAQLFKEALEQSGIPCTIRLRRGIDIQAGCGQLAVKVERAQEKT
jgi:23S rRNA (adenine2503-C2)-methyltransferase